MVKQLLRTNALTFVALLVAMLNTSGTASAAIGSSFQYKYEGNTFWYRIINETDRTCLLQKMSSYNQPKGDIILPGFPKDGNDEYKLTTIEEGCFLNCTEITSVDIPGTVTAIEHDAFYGCTGLKEIIIPNSVINIGEYAFYECKGLTDFHIPEKITSLPQGFLSFCTGLSTISIPNSVTKIGYRAFSGCSGLEKVNLPESLDVIDDEAFLLCVNLADIEIPASVTKINSSAFQGCKALSSVVIPASVNSLGTNIFKECDLKYLYILTDLIPQKYGIFSPFGNNPSCTLFVIPECLDTYNSNSLIVGDVAEIKGLVKATKVEFAEGKTLKMVPGQTLKLTPAVTPSNTSLQEFIWKSTNPDMVSVDNEGNVTYIGGIADGNTCNIIVELKYSDNLMAEIEVCETKPGLDVEIVGDGLLLINGQKIASNETVEGGNFEVIVLPDDNNTISVLTLGNESQMDNLSNHILKIKDFQKHETLKAVFVPENETSLSVKGTDSHSLTHYYKEGARAKIDLLPEDGWELYSLSFNGEDVTNEIIDNSYTTPALTGNNGLEVVMKAITGAYVDLSAVARRTISFRRHGDTVEIINLDEGETISIYDADGVCEYRGNKHSVTLTRNKIYFLRTEKETLKFVF